MCFKNKKMQQEKKKQNKNHSENHKKKREKTGQKILEASQNWPKASRSFTKPVGSFPKKIEQVTYLCEVEAGKKVKWAEPKWRKGCALVCEMYWGAPMSRILRDVGQPS